MEQLLKGVQAFQKSAFEEQKELFEQLRKGQKPLALFITCSDSRIDPCLLTQTQPGELFVLRNAGNIVPPFGATNGGEGATIEYALGGLDIKHIIICGHHHCGAMTELLHPKHSEDLPVTTKWLRHAAATKAIMDSRSSEAMDDPVLETVRQNVLVQIDNTKTHPYVAARLAAGELTIHGWVYHFDTGKVEVWDPEQKQFVIHDGSRALT